MRETIAEVLARRGIPKYTLLAFDEEHPIGEVFIAPPHRVRIVKELSRREYDQRRNKKSAISYAAEYRPGRAAVPVEEFAGNPEVPDWAKFFYECEIIGVLP